MITEIRYWQCNDCKLVGPVFQGHTEQDRPPGWLVGSVDRGPEETIKMAICPECLPAFRAKFR